MKCGRLVFLSMYKKRFAYMDNNILSVVNIKIIIIVFDEGITIKRDSYLSLVHVSLDAYHNNVITARSTQSITRCFRLYDK